MLNRNREQARSHIDLQWAQETRNPPQLLRHRQRYHRRGFGAQHTGAEAGGVVAGGFGLLDLGLRQPTFGADQERQGRRPGMADQRLGHRMQHQLQFGLGLLQPVGQQQRRVDHRHGGAPALFAGADRHLAPVQQAFVGAFVLEAYFAAFAENRCDLADPQLRGFLDRPIHALAPGQALAEVNAQRRFRLAGELLVQLYPHALLADFGQGAAKLLAGTVEHLHRIALGHAQHPADVMGLGFRQFMVAEAQGASMKKRDSLMWSLCKKK